MERPDVEKSMKRRSMERLYVLGLSTAPPQLP